MLASAVVDALDLVYGLNGRRVDARGAIALLEPLPKDNPLVAVAMAAACQRLHLSDQIEDWAWRALASNIEGLACNPVSWWAAGFALLTTKRYEQALSFLRLAEARDCALAQHTLGFMYEHGHGVSRDKHRASFLYALAARKGHAAARCNLACLFWCDDFSDASVHPSLHMLELAAAQDLPEALNNLGTLHQLGIGVPQNHAKAIALYARASALELPNASTNLGRMRQLGLGLPQDLLEAERLYRMAAGRGHAPAHALLSRLSKAA